MTLLRFSTQSVPPEARKSAVESVIAPHSDIGIDFVRDQPPSISFGMRMLPDVQVVGGTSSSFRCRVTPDSDHFILFVGQAGVGAIEEDSGHRVEVRPGTASIAPVDRAWTSVAQDSVSFLSLALPHTLLESGRVRRDLAMREHLPASPAMHLLQSYAGTVLREDMEISPAEASRFAAHILDLVLIVLGTEDRDDVEWAGRRGLRAARLAAIKADIEAHLFLPELSTGWMMARHRISERYLRSLFSDEQTSFTDFVLGRRLERVMRRLVDLRHMSETVSTIAFEAGFNDLSWFNRAFRRRFGMTPSEARERAFARTLRTGK